MTEKRKRIIVKKRFQHNVALVITLALFISINALFIVGYLIIDSMTDIQQLKQTLAYAIAAAELISLALIYRLSIKESHRIAGPVFVLERSLKKIEAGELDFTVNLRTHDHFHETADAFNDMLTGLEQRIGRAQTLARELAATTQDREQQRRLEQLVEELGHFRTKESQTTDSQG